MVSIAQSAGLLLYRRHTIEIEVLLVHPGGPFWAKRDAGSWSIPKGEYAIGEDPWDNACREFFEELGTKPPPGEPIDLGDVQQKAGKRVRAFALRGDFEVDTLKSNLFKMEWPLRSGKAAAFPEVDRAAWFSIPVARTKINPAQARFLDRLAASTLG